MYYRPCLDGCRDIGNWLNPCLRMKPENTHDRLKEKVIFERNIAGYVLKSLSKLTTYILATDSKMEASVGFTGWKFHANRY